MKPFIWEVNNAILDTFFQCASNITVATAEFIVERKRKNTKIKPLIKLRNFHQNNMTYWFAQKSSNSLFCQKLSPIMRCRFQLNIRSVFKLDSILRAPKLKIKTITNWKKTAKKKDKENLTNFADWTFFWECQLLFM